MANDCRPGYFIYHAFSENSSNRVWDACLKYDIDDDPDNVVGSTPILCGSTMSSNDATWQLPCNVQDTTYLDHLVDDYHKKGGYCSDPLNCGSLQNVAFTIRLVYE